MAHGLTMSSCSCNLVVVYGRMFVEWCQGDAFKLYHAKLAVVPSLRPFLEYPPHLVCASQVHGGRLGPNIAREWTLARCGHHPFPDGRNARHRASADPQQSCLCGNPSWNLFHKLRHCSLIDMQRQTWKLHMRSCAAIIAQLSNEDFLRLIFLPLHPSNAPPLIAAHVHFVACVKLSLRLL